MKYLRLLKHYTVDSDKVFTLCIVNTMDMSKIVIAVKVMSSLGIMRYYWFWTSRQHFFNYPQTCIIRVENLSRPYSLILHEVAVRLDYTVVLRRGEGCFTVCSRSSCKKGFIVHGERDGVLEIKPLSNAEECATSIFWGKGIIANLC